MTDNTEDGFHIHVTETNRVSIRVQKDGDSLLFTVSPDAVKSLCKELQHAHMKAENHE